MKNYFLASMMVIENFHKEKIKNIQHRYSASLNALYITSAILFVFGSISLMNMLMVDFQNKKHEFGLLEAVGTTRQLSDVSTDLALKYMKVFSIIDVKYQEYQDWKTISPFYQNVDREGAWSMQHEIEKTSIST